MVRPIARWAAFDRPATMHSAGGEQRQHDRQREQHVHGLSLRAGVEVGQLDVDAVAADAAVLDVVGDLVVLGEQPAAVGEGEQQGGDAEADHDRREHERLGQRVGEVGGVAGSDDRRVAARGRR